MVLQMAPQRSQVWGFCPPGDKVTVVVVPEPEAAAGGPAPPPIAANTSLYLGNSTWSALLPRTAGSLSATYRITATSKLTGASTSISGILFGDVHFCSGQSNMDKSISYLANKTAETADMLNYPAIRLFHVGQWNGGEGGHPLTPHTPQTEVQPYPYHQAGHPSLNWTTPCTNMSSPASCRTSFSAVCWMMGRALFAALEPPRPIGLLQASWGGTSDILWSSAKALAQCGEYDDATDKSPKTTLWNSAVVPLLRTTIRTAVWYQGEQDAAVGSAGGPSGPTVNQTRWPYNCTFPAMIADWRTRWSAATLGEVPNDFPFGYVQLNGNGKGEYPGPYNNTHGAGKQDRHKPSPNTSQPPLLPPVRFDYSEGGFPGLRWAQSAGFGFNPNPTQPNSFQAVILDTPASDGGIHSPYKEAAGARLARASLARASLVQAYGRSDVQPGPVLGSVSPVRGAVGGGTVTVTISNPGGGVELHTDGSVGFEVLPAEEHPYSVLWTNVKILSHSKDSVTLGPVPANATRLRYLWYSNACGLKLFNCPVYVVVPPLKGGLSGEHGFLPLGPFLAVIPRSKTDDTTVAVPQM